MITINKNLIYIGLIFVILSLTVVVFIKVNATGKVVQNINKQNNQELDKYRLDPIPAECKLPEYEESINDWKEHLSHHQNTLYCLDYFK